MDETLTMHQAAVRVQGRLVWRQLSLTLSAGQRLSVEGANGSGKSLLLRALAGLIPLAEGELLWHGQPIPPVGVTRFRRAVLYLPQQTVFRSGTLRENFIYPFAFRSRVDQQYDEQNLIPLLHSIAWPISRMDQSVASLSGGELQVAALLRALLLRPTVLLADEAFSALDEQMRERCHSLLLDWMAADPAHAMVWVSHNREEQQRMGDSHLHLGEH